LIAHRPLLEELFRCAVAAAHPSAFLAKHLPEPAASGRLIILAAGKAAGSMTEVAEEHYRNRLQFPAARMDGLAVTRYGYSRQTKTVPIIEAGHPIPDESGIAAAEKTLALARSADASDLVLVFISGGASANWIAPAAGLKLGEKRAVTQGLLRSGAGIDEINTVRKHLSRIKGGRLAAEAFPARVVTLAISDVPRDEPSVIGSGPTVPDPSTLADARAILAKRRLDAPAAVTHALHNPANETPKPGDHVFDNSSFAIVARPADAFRAAEEAIRASGYECVFLGDSLEGEAADVAAEHARFAIALQKQGRRAAILSGGELTVTMRGSGRGGPNQEYALALALGLDGSRAIAAIAADTDGTDGGTGSASDPAGAFVDGGTAARGRALGLDPAAFLANNDSTGFFSRLDDLVVPGPTFTNVNDFRAILVDRP
jgi:hydroxypyruvate reductase